jgi:hypothetical protein
MLQIMRGRPVLMPASQFRALCTKSHEFIALVHERSLAAHTLYIALKARIRCRNELPPMMTNMAGSRNSAIGMII